MKNIVFVVLLWTLAACTTTDQRIKSMLRDGASVVELSVKDPFHLAGDYEDLETQYEFALTRQPHRIEWNLQTVDDGVVLAAVWTPSALEVQVYQEKQIIPREPLFEPRLTAPTRAAMERFVRSELYQSLPKLSRALAMLGVTGKRFPASQPVHQSAMIAAAIHGPLPDRTGGEDERVPFMYANPYASRHIKIALDDFSIVDRGFECGVEHGPFADKDAEIGRADACADSAFCSLESDPNGDGCFAMCGEACDCWEWVCGHCCKSWVCGAHDFFVRNCLDDGLVQFCPISITSSAAIVATEIIGLGVFSCGGLGIPFHGW